MARGRDHHRHDRIAHGEIGRAVGPDLVDHAGRVHPRDVRRWILPQRFGSGAVPHIGVGRINRGRVDPDPQLTGRGMHLGQIDDLQRLRPPE